MEKPWAHLTLSYSRPAVTRKAITSAAAKIGLPFPPLYVEFLLAHNGGIVPPGEPVPRAFPIEGSSRGDKGLVHVFYNVGSGDAVDLANMYKGCRRRLRTGLIPIAADPGGEKICLACKGKDIGKVFFWEADREAHEREKPNDKFCLVARSLEEFFRGLEVAK